MANVQALNESYMNLSCGSDDDMQLNSSSDAMHAFPRHSSTPKILSRRLLFDGVDENENSAVAASATYSPPYRRVRTLQLMDRPLTPRTITANSMVTPLRRARLFPTSVLPPVTTEPAAKHNNNIEVPLVNVNPFTPEAIRNKSKKRSRYSVSPGVPEIVMQEQDDDAWLQPPLKRLALSENNISRYAHEFAEIHLLGSGQFSQVFKCMNRLDGCAYAIKRSKKPIAGSLSERAAMNEVWAHAVLGRHENIVGYHSAWAEHNHMYIQTEYCNRGSLAERIANEPLELLECQRLLQQIAEGLNYMDAHSLVHLDIKPDNIFVSLSKKRKRSLLLSSNESADDGFAEDEEVTYKIGDLGHVTSTMDPNVEEGDCRYLPMEVLQENYTNLPKADIFALGLTILEVSGYGPLPKNGDEWQLLRKGVIPKDVKYLPTDFVDLLLTMMHPDPEKRPTAEAITQKRFAQHVAESSKSYEQLHRDYKASLLKAEFLSKQLDEAKRCIKSLAPDAKRLVGKKNARSVSSIDF